jgi:hypothetical protein
MTTPTAVLMAMTSGGNNDNGDDNDDDCLCDLAFSFFLPPRKVFYPSLAFSSFSFPPSSPPAPTGEDEV